MRVGAPVTKSGVQSTVLSSRRDENEDGEWSYQRDRPLCNWGATHGSEGAIFSAAHCRAKRLSSAAVCRLSLCLIFSQWVSTVLRLSRNCAAISRGLYAAPKS